MVLAALFQLAMLNAGDPQASLSYAGVGDRFGVSRTHVRKLLIAAEEIGLVKLSTRGDLRVELLPRLWSSHDRAIAVGMYIHDTGLYGSDQGASIEIRAWGRSAPLIATYGSAMILLFRNLIFARHPFWTASFSSICGKFVRTTATISREQLGQRWAGDEAAEAGPSR
jgi:hypothetical protein